MKIALVIDHLDPRRGGAEQWTFQHAERLLARGHEVHVVAQGVNGPAARLDIVPHAFGPVRSLLGRAAAAEAALERLQVDMVHDIGLGWHSHVLQSEDGSRLAQWEQKLLLLPAWQRPWKRAMLRALPRYRDFRRLMLRQFGDPRRIVIAVSQMCAGLPALSRRAGGADPPGLSRHRQPAFFAGPSPASARGDSRSPGRLRG